MLFRLTLSEYVCPVQATELQFQLMLLHPDPMEREDVHHSHWVVGTALGPTSTGGGARRATWVGVTVRTNPLAGGTKVTTP